MRHSLSATPVASSPAGSPGRSDEGGAPAAVILVHGLWLHGAALMLLRHRLARRGFSVRTFSYPSVRRSLDANSRALSRCVAETAGDSVALVGHSLGGLVVLNMLAQTPDPRIRRVVLMGSPCAGSHCASFLLRTPGLARLLGRSIGDALLRGPHWEVPAGAEIGVLAGCRSFGLGRIVPGLARPNDGVVALEETRLPASRDAIVLPVSHSGMLFSRSCARQVAHFLDKGCFLHA